MSFSWVDIPVKDLDRAIRFYSAVLGAEIARAMVGGSLIGLLPRGQQGVGGCLVAAQGSFQPSSWGALIHLECHGRLKAAQAAVEASGGKVVTPFHRTHPGMYRVIVMDPEGNRVALLSDSVERVVSTAAADTRLGLARELASQGQSVRASKVLRDLAGDPDPGLALAARRDLSGLVPGYHIPMMNDPRRCAAWEDALGRAIKPGMQVLEIGTGPGLLALMAARAGAQVTTCEYHPVVAAVAQDMVARNGFEHRIKVVSKSSLQLQIGVDMERPADLLFCDNFSDNMFSFQPLQSLADARARLLVPGAQVLPGAAAVRVALGRWQSYARLFNTDRSCGFDLAPLSSFVPESIDFEIGDAGFELVSELEEAFRFDFRQSSWPEAEERQLRLEGSGEVHGVVQWIRLELDADTVLEARPEPGTTFFSNPRFHPFTRPRDLGNRGAVSIELHHDSQSLALWPVRSENLNPSL
ncbi:MAG TPA: VOC family protein [Candidatus Xenobia bacterium]|jgi:type II protein arginine methyltransferase